MFKTSLAVALAGTVFGVASAHAAMIDLTTAGSSGAINGAQFFTNEDQPTGTGVFDPFVRIQVNGFEQGYNTSNPFLPFDEKPGPWTHDLRLSDLGTTTDEGVLYYEFRLDINEASGGDHNLLSLDRVQIYTSGMGSQNTTNVSSLGTLRYDLDAGGDNWVKMDYSLGHGSGSGDLTMLVPVANFDGSDPNSFVYLYSAFGTHYSASAGFEEWATRGPVIPAPGTAMLAFIGLGLINHRRRK